MDKFAKLLQRLRPIEEPASYVADNYGQNDIAKEVSDASLALSPEDVHKILNAESTGGKFTRNPASTAKGSFQILDKTRKEALDRLKNEENVEIPANPDRQDALLMKNLVDKTENALLNSQNGPKDVNLDNIYLAHHFGIQGALDALNNPKSSISKKRFRKIAANLSKPRLTTIDEVKPARNLQELLED